MRLAKSADGTMESRDFHSTEVPVPDERNRENDLEDNESRQGAGREGEWNTGGGRESQQGGKRSGGSDNDENEGGGFRGGPAGGGSKKK
jgi:hypothetical protein